MASAYRTPASMPPRARRGLVCPWCGERAVGRLGKSFVGNEVFFRLLTRKCACCGRRVSVGRGPRLGLWTLPLLAAHLVSFLPLCTALSWWTLVPVFIAGYGAGFVL